MNLMLAIYFMLNVFVGYFGNSDEIKFNTSRKSILDIYNHTQAEKDLGIKKASLEISDNGFLRYKCVGNNNKIAYYSVKLNKVSEIVYLGSENAGWLAIKCENESVIYQTYQDKDGNVDDMVNLIKIPLKNINMSDLSSLIYDFDVIRGSLNTNTNL